MRRFVAAFLGLLVVPLALCSCAHLWQVAATEDVPGQPPSADHLDVGHVAFVRGAESWVLISLDKGVQLPTGALLQAKSTVNSEELAQLKLTQQKSTGYQAASILSGAPRYGDAVIMMYPKGDGSDPEDQIQLDDIPPLLKRRAPDPATLTSQDGNRTLFLCPLKQISCSPILLRCWWSSRLKFEPVVLSLGRPPMIQIRCCFLIGRPRMIVKRFCKSYLSDDIGGGGIAVYPISSFAFGSV